MIKCCAFKCVSRHPRSPTETSPSKEALTRRQGQLPSTDATKTSLSSATIFTLALMDRLGTCLRLHATVCIFGTIYNWCASIKEIFVFSVFPFRFNTVFCFGKLLLFNALILFFSRIVRFNYHI